MIKFFRKIRQRLLTENKFSKYLIYAIGEIILVVIGILIALYINNKNQERASDTKITNILKEIQSDIITNIRASNDIFDFQLYTDSISKLILNNHYTAEDYRTQKLYNIGYNYRDFKIVTNGFDNLKSNIDNVPEKYQYLLPEIKELYTVTKTDIDVYNNKLRETVYKNIDDLRNFDWYQDAYKSIVSEAEIDYKLNDNRYKNMVSNYMNYRANIFNISNEYRLDAANLYHKISKATGNKDAIPDVLNYMNLDMKFLNTYTGDFELKETLNNVFWPKTITFKIIEGEFTVASDGNWPITSLRAKNKTVFYSSGHIVVFNRPETGQVYISRASGNFYAIYESTVME